VEANPAFNFCKLWNCFASKYYKSQSVHSFKRHYKSILTTSSANFHEMFGGKVPELHNGYYGMEQHD